MTGSIEFWNSVATKLRVAFEEAPTISDKVIMARMVGTAEGAAAALIALNDQAELPAGVGN